MATIKAMIRATNGKDTAFVRFRLSDGRNVQLFYTSFISVKVDLWDAKKEAVSMRKLCNTTYRRETNKAIQDTKEKIFEVYEANKGFINNSEDLANVMNGKKFKDLESKTNVFDICEIINAYTEANTLSDSTRGKHKCLRTILKHYGQIAAKKGLINPFDDIRTLTSNDIDKLKDFIKNEYKSVPKYVDIYEVKPYNDISRKGKPPKERSNNTIVGYLKVLRAVLRFAVKHDIITRSPMESYKIQREIYGTPYYLTKQERDYLSTYDLSDRPNLEKVRDTFILQCFLGCRIGDLLRLTRQNINKGYLEYIPSKTKGKRANIVRVPLHDMAKAIIQKYVTDKTILPSFKDDTRAVKSYCVIEYINRKIKEVFKAVGLCRLVVVLNPITRKEEQKPLYMVASSHMARRTFIGLLYKQIKDPNIIASMSGHAPNSTAFARYRNIDDDIKNEVINLL